MFEISHLSPDPFLGEISLFNSLHNLYGGPIVTSKVCRFLTVKFEDFLPLIFHDHKVNYLHGLISVTSTSLLFYYTTKLLFKNNIYYRSTLCYYTTTQQFTLQYISPQNLPTLLVFSALYVKC